MARRAFELSFAHGHVAEALQLRGLLLMTGDARLGNRRGFELARGGLRIVDRMTGRAADVPNVVWTALPERMVRAAVTGEAGRGRLTRRHRREHPDFGLVPRLGVLFSRTVTRLARTIGRRRRRRRARVRRLPVQRGREVLSDVFVAGGTGVVADELTGCRGGRRRRLRL